MSYASGTSVTEDRSRAEIERLLMKFGSDEFGYITRQGEAIIGFRIKNIRCEMRVPLPCRDDEAFTLTANGKDRSSNAAYELWAKEVRRKWRSLCLVIKAKLVAVEDGVTTFEAEFLPYMICGDGNTITTKMLPMIEAAQSGKGPLALPAPNGSR